MTPDQEREAFAEWVKKHSDYSDFESYEIANLFDAWQARAALQSQYEIQFQVWRSTDSCMEFWSWDEADQYDYDRALPENRRIIQIIKEGQ